VEGNSGNDRATSKFKIGQYISPLTPSETKPYLPSHFHRAPPAAAPIDSSLAQEPTFSLGRPQQESLAPPSRRPEPDFPINSCL
jgi:hypothetical protein